MISTSLWGLDTIKGMHSLTAIATSHRAIQKAKKRYRSEHSGLEKQR